MNFILRLDKEIKIFTSCPRQGSVRHPVQPAGQSHLHNLRSWWIHATFWLSVQEFFFSQTRTSTLETCSVLYESTSKTPLLRLSWNMADEHIIAATQLDSPRIILIDTLYISLSYARFSRKPLSPLCYLDGHGGCINSICWAPQSSKYLVSGSDDSNVWFPPVVSSSLVLHLEHLSCLGPRWYKPLLSPVHAS